MRGATARRVDRNTVADYRLNGMKIRGVAIIAVAWMILAISESKAGLKILAPAEGDVFAVNEAFTIAGVATPAKRISAIRVRVAGQTLSPVGTGRWSVLVTIGRPGVFRIVVASRIGNRWVAKRARYVTIAP